MSLHEGGCGRTHSQQPKDATGSGDACSTTVNESHIFAQVLDQLAQGQFVRSHRCLTLVMFDLETCDLFPNWAPFLHYHTAKGLQITAASAEIWWKVPRKVKKRNKETGLLSWDLSLGAAHLSAKLHVTGGQYMLWNCPVKHPSLLTSVFRCKCCRHLKS